MESSQPQLYITDPFTVKDGVGSHTSYSMQGTRVAQAMIRRYRDFDAFRNKLRERWPGIYIPAIPPKQVVGKMEEELVNYRMSMMNIFFQKLSTIPHLWNGEEMDLFLTNSPDVPRTMAGLPSQSYEDILKKYSKTFTDYDDNFDTNTGREAINAFAKKLQEIKPKLDVIRDLVQTVRNRDSSLTKTYYSAINMLSIYEKESVNNYVAGNEQKLVFLNMKNVDLCKAIGSAQENVINPYEKLLDSLNADCLDCEAMLEGLADLANLGTTYGKLTANLASTNTDLINLQSGKTTIKGLISFKSKEQDISTLMMKKQKLEKDIDCLGQIIKVVTFMKEREIRSYKQISIDKYYEELHNLEVDTTKNNDIFDNLWEEIIKDRNIAEYH